MERCLLSAAASLSGKEEVCMFIFMFMFPVTRISEFSYNLLLYNFDENVPLKIASQYISSSVPGLSPFPCFVTYFQDGSVGAAVCFSAVEQRLAN